MDVLGAVPVPATIYAVADRAGVSIATVSRVLAERSSGSPEVRRRVLRAVDELEYVPRSSARNLATGNYQAFGLVLGDLSGAYFADLALGFDSATAEAGSSTVLQLADRRSEPVLAARGLLSRVDALALGPSALPDEAVRRLARRVPVVVLGRGRVEGCDALDTESVASTRALTAHVLGHDRRRLLFVGDVEGSWDARRRFIGFGEACRSAGVEPGAPLLTVQTEAAGTAVADGLVQRVRTGEIDGLVCVNDELALAIVQRLQERGIRTPEDVAVVGFDDVPAARYLTPALTTVRQPVFELGRAGAAVLAERLADPAAPRTARTLPTELVIRGSCGCSPAQRRPAQQEDAA